jgi:hypothetical protein
MKSFIIILIFSSIIVNQSYGQKDKLYPYRVKNKWGFSDVNGNILIKPQYDSVTVFFEHYFTGIYCSKVVKNNKEAYIDSSNKYLTRKFDKIDFSFSNEKYNYIIKIKDKYGVMDRNYKILIPFNYDKLYQDDMDLYGNTKDTYYGKVKDIYFKISIEDTLNISKITETTFNEKSKDVIFTEYEPTSNSKQNINEKLFMEYEMLMKNEIDSVSRKYFIYTPYYLVYKNGKTGLTLFENIKNKNKNLLIEPLYENIKRIENWNGNLVFIITKNGNVGALSQNNKELIPFIYDDITEIFGNSALTFKNDLYGVLNLDTGSEIKPKYKTLKANSYFKGLTLFTTRDFGYLDFINANGIEYFE